MKLNIKELGIIKQAQIDLDKKFLLFCGRNSTGKTYASYILQAFLADGNAFNLSCLPEIVDQIVDTGKFKVKREYIEEWLNANCEAVKAQLGSIFGVSDTTRDKLFLDFSLSAIYTDEDFNKTLATFIDAKMNEGSSVWIVKKTSTNDFVSIESNVNSSVLKSHDHFRAAVLVSHILRNLAFGSYTGVRMLTVERNSIYTFKTELSLSRNELIDQIQQTNKSEINVIDIINKSTRRYPLAVRNSLKIANDLDNVQKYESPFSSIATQIEKDLLCGEVSMTKNGDVEFHAEGMAKSKKLPFHLSSSIVKTMASLVIYLRHIAKAGDTLIIDEPEMNFHPDVQVLLATMFAILTSKGLRIVVSTHSDYIVREINNLIMASALQQKGKTEFVEELGYTKDMLLNHNDVSVLCFVKAGRRTVRVNPLPLDDEGFAIDSIDSVINQQNIKAERLYAELIDNE